MSDFSFRRHLNTGKWVILAPRRGKRTNVGGKTTEVCPFCVGQEANEDELYRVGGQTGDSNWHIRVIPNKFPFTSHHELILHSPDHHKNIDELSFSQVELLFQTYRQRFNMHVNQGQVYIFHNRGHEAGESLPHPHTQLAVVPHSVNLAIPPLDMAIYKRKSGFFSKDKHPEAVVETDHFFVFCPETSDWPDEVWIAPKRQNQTFGQTTDAEITDFALAVSRLIQIFDLRHGSEFPFNFYIYPGTNWYLRLIPRLKILGGFELGTQVMVNTQDPAGTLAFIREHFWKPDPKKIKIDHKADYIRSV